MWLQVWSRGSAFLGPHLESLCSSASVPGGKRCVLFLVACWGFPDGGAGGCSAPRVTQGSMRCLAPGAQRAGPAVYSRSAPRAWPQLALSQHRFRFPLMTN